MPVTGRFLASRFRGGAGVYLSTYVMMVQTEVLPVFANLGTRASRISDSEFDRLKALPTPLDCDGDLSFLAERAQEKGEAYYTTMDNLRRASLTLYTVGLFHLTEQHLANFCRDPRSVSPYRLTQASKGLLIGSKSISVSI